MTHTSRERPNGKVFLFKSLVKEKTEWYGWFKECLRNLGTMRPFQREILSQSVQLSPRWISRELGSVKKANPKRLHTIQFF